MFRSFLYVVAGVCVLGALSGCSTMSEEGCTDCEVVRSYNDAPDSDRKGRWLMTRSAAHDMGDVSPSDAHEAPDSMDPVALPVVEIGSFDRLGDNGPRPSVEVFSLDDGQPVDLTPALPAQPRRTTLFEPYDDYAPSNDVALKQPVGVRPSQAHLFFAHNSADISADEQAMVRDMARDYAPGKTVSVEGYASTRAEVQNPIERKIANLRVSMKRALRVSEQLIRSGVPAESIRTVARGETVQQPGAVLDGKSGEAAARRVDVYEGVR